MALDVARIKAIIFDIDGTLSDSDDQMVNQVERLVKPFTFFISGKGRAAFARWLVMAGESPMNLLMYWMDALSLDDDFARAFERIAQRRGSGNKPFLLMSGAHELLRAAQSEYALTIVSARDAATTGAFIDQFDLRDYFLEIITSQTCKFTKPYPDPIQYAARVMGLEPRDCLMIGDTTVDILAGKRAGAQTVGLLCGFGTKRELQKAGADVILSDLEELRALLFTVSPR